MERETPTFWRAYNLKERFRDVFKSPDLATAEARLDSWLSWACRCRIPAMVEASKKVRRRREAILRAVELGISNARVEAINNKIKVTQRMHRYTDICMDERMVPTEATIQRGVVSACIV